MFFKTFLRKSSEYLHHLQKRDFGQQVTQVVLWNYPIFYGASAGYTCDGQLR